MCVCVRVRVRMRACARAQAQAHSGQALLAWKRQAEGRRSGQPAHQETMEVARQISAGPSSSMNQSKSSPHGTVVATKITGLATNRRKKAVPTFPIAIPRPQLSVLHVNRQQWNQHSKHGLHGTALRTIHHPHRSLHPQSIVWGHSCLQQPQSIVWEGQKRATAPLDGHSSIGLIHCTRRKWYGISILHDARRAVQQ